jgi:hypothetical protein
MTLNSRVRHRSGPRVLSDCWHTRPGVLTASTPAQMDVSEWATQEICGRETWGGTSRERGERVEPCHGHRK